MADDPQLFSSPSTTTAARSDSNLPDNSSSISSRSSKKPCVRSMNNLVVFNPTCYPSVSEWASLPNALLLLILAKLFEPIDHVRFASVCKGWCSPAKENNHTTRCCRQVLPMVLILSRSEPEGNTSPTKRRVVYSISEGKVYNNVGLPVPYSKRCCGSSHGWLATVDLADQPMNITLMNPFKKAATIRLPPLEFNAEDMIPTDHTNPYENYVRKVILSADPSSSPDNYMVASLYSRDSVLSFTKAGQNYWTPLRKEVMLRSTLIVKRMNFISDVVFYQGKIYAVDCRGIISSVDVKTSQENLLTAMFPTYASAQYLVVSTKGDLFHVRRVAMQELCTESFYVYKLVFNDREGAFEHVGAERIEDEAFFVGVGINSFSILASNFHGCKPNCIYETCNDNPCIMNILSLEDKTITQIQLPNPNCATPPAIWILPIFSGLCRFT